MIDDSFKHKYLKQLIYVQKLRNYIEFEEEKVECNYSYTEEEQKKVQDWLERLKNLFRWVESDYMGISDDPFKYNSFIIMPVVKTPEPVNKKSSSSRSPLRMTRK